MPPESYSATQHEQSEAIIGRRHEYFYIDRIFIWEPIENAHLRIMKGYVYLNICGCKTLHRG